MDDNSIQTASSPFDNFFGYGTMLGKIITSVFYVTIIAIILSAAIHYHAIAQGDEPYYYDYAKAIGKNGIYIEMSKGNPVGYSTVVYLLSKSGLPLLVVGRFLTLISTLIFFLGLRYVGRKIFKLSGAYLHLALISSFLAVLGAHCFFRFVPDMFYYVIIVWIFAFTCKVVNNWDSWQMFALAGAFLSFSVLIRPVSLVFFPAFLLAIIYDTFFSKTSSGKKVISILSFLIAFMLVFFAQQYPSLQKKGALAFESKINDPNTKANWEQRDILTTLKKAKGEKVAGAFYASWKECDAYLIKNGPNSLPSGPIQALFWDPEFVIKYYAIGFVEVLRGFIRDTGFVFILPLLFLFKSSFVEYRKYSFFTVASLVFLAFLLFNNLNLVEIRHILIPMVLMALSGVALLKYIVKEGSKYANLLFYLQFVSVFVILLLDIKFYVGDFLTQGIK